MIEFFQEGGPFMWPLGLWSVLSIAFFLERIYTYAGLRSEDELAEVTTDINSRIDSGTGIDQLKEYCAEVGKLEGSNSSAVRAMTDLMTASRMFEAMQRAISTFRGINSRMVRIVPR